MTKTNTIIRRFYTDWSQYLFEFYIIKKIIKFLINDQHRNENILSVIAPELLTVLGKYFYE